MVPHSNITKGHFIRSIMESLGYIICRNLESIRDMGLNIQQIRTMGGGPSQICGIRSKQMLLVKHCGSPAVLRMRPVWVQLFWLVLQLGGTKAWKRQ